MPSRPSWRQPSHVLIGPTEASRWLETMYELGYEVSDVPPAELPVATVYLVERHTPDDGTLTPTELVGALLDLAAAERELPHVELVGSGLVLIRKNYAP